MTVEAAKLRRYRAVLVVCVVIIIMLGAGFVSTCQNSLNQINSLNADKTNLQSQVNLLISDKNTLQNQISTYSAWLSGNITLLNNQIAALNKSYTDLLREYEDLLFHYNLLNKPTSSFTTVKDLNITLTIDRTTYYYEDPVSGNITMTYLNGTAFRGAFILYIQHLTKEAMSTTAEIAIDGFTRFYLSPPVFRFGPGNYTIGISSLSTVNGYIIETRWQVFPSVQVEAK